MNLMGYLITLANLQSFEKSGGPLKDLSIKVAEIQSLASELKMQPGFDLENFRQTGYYRVGTVGKYISKNMRDYIYDGIGNPTDEAVLLTLYFKENFSGTQTIVNSPDRTLSFYLKRDGIDEDVKRGVEDYVTNVALHPRNKRTVIFY